MYYVLSNNSLNYDTSASICAAQGGRLATATNDTQFELLQDISDSFPTGTRIWVI
jgi:hypothetical protein